MKSKEVAPQNKVHEIHVPAARWVQLWQEHLASFPPSFPESDREIVSGDNYTSIPPSVNDSIRFMQLSSYWLDASVIENFNKIAFNLQCDRTGCRDYGAKQEVNFIWQTDVKW